jgi:hypothetical protein
MTVCLYSTRVEMVSRVSLGMFHSMPLSPSICSIDSQPFLLELQLGNASVCQSTCSRESSWTILARNRVDNDDVIEVEWKESKDVRADSCDDSVSVRQKGLRWSSRNGGH